MTKKILRWRGDTDVRKWSGLIKLERNVEKNTAKFVMDAAKWLVNDAKGIRNSWSANSPSTPGQPPAIDTGNLDSAIQNALTNARYRGGGGRFAKKQNSMALTLSFTAEDGDSYHGRGNYLQALEFGREGAEARPFVKPAVDRLKREFPQLAKRTIRNR